ncbi:hypothetical protein NP233_g10536 [Leucocoprinus birnbaumii]|uniref:Uncharacterized protein n=1 Tax=Leucocoprinus birnbaumii TaxID=56174 RepID=A0AAD5VIA3_9AGAR|nr:hypothetical protein NP233_g10536 [Leucocoprinus birnbaumii]
MLRVTSQQAGITLGTNHNQSSADVDTEETATMMVTEEYISAPASDAHLPNLFTPDSESLLRSSFHFPDSGWAAYLGFVLYNHSRAGPLYTTSTMTEYDYSPEAVDRYIAKQHSIARWVDNTNRYEPGNPFLPSETSGTPYQPESLRYASPERDYEEDYHRSSSRHHRDDKDRQRRPHYERYDSHTSHTGSSRKNSRSSSRPHTSQAHYPSQPLPANGQGYQYPNGQQPYSYFNQPAQSPYSSNPSTPLTSPQPRTPYEQPPNMPTLVPINGGNGGYYIVPPKGTTFQVVQAQSPTPGQPWYKRMLSPPPSGAHSSQKLSKSSSSGGHRKRSSKWSLDIY